VRAGVRTHLVGGTLAQLLLQPDAGGGQLGGGGDRLHPAAPPPKGQAAVGHGRNDFEHVLDDPVKGRLLLGLSHQLLADSREEGR
jgi:hypothetical protein